MRGPGSAMGGLALICLAISFLSCAALSPSLTTEILDQDGIVCIGQKDRPILRYRFGTVPFKPYIESLYTPNGLNVLEDSPSDHKHHHGVMFAVGAEGINFWEENDPAQMGSQITREISKADRLPEIEDEGEGLAESLDWKGPDGTVLLTEERTVWVHPSQSSGPNLLTWAGALRVPKGRNATALSGSHYFGLGVRFARDMAGGTFMTPEGGEGDLVRGEERLTYSRWCAYQAQTSGKPVTVALFDHPLNPRSPCRWFTMPRPFAYLAATLNLEKQPRTVSQDHPLQFRFGIAVWDGRVEAKEIEEAYADWVNQIRPLGDRVNLALKKNGTRAFASSEYGPDYVAGNAIDGRYAVREKDKWNSKSNIMPHTLRIDLGSPRLFDRVVLRHEGVIPGGEAQLCNTEDFRVQSSDRQWGPWRDLIPPVRGNQDNVTVHDFEETSARFVRILIETGEQNDRDEYGRLPEVEIYGLASDKTMKNEEKP